MKSKLWGGRFSKATHKLVEEFTKSIHFDHKLARYDCIGSLAHIDVLKKAGLLSAGEHKEIQKVLNRILHEIENGTFRIDRSFEDIHSYIQHLVETKAGKAGLKLHTCRSRNDQVAFDVKLYCLINLLETDEALKGLRAVLLKLSGENAALYMPGYTHLQHAMPVSAGDHLSAYEQMLERDSRRLKHASFNFSLTMGAGALAGTPIDSKNYTTSDVDPISNSIDAVSDRDFVIEILSALAIIGMHLSRLAEDMILWSTKEFDFIDIDDAFCTGSSLMPQKKNPDVLELVRGYTGRLYGNLVNVLVMMKGLPLSYNRDMQHDKEPLFDSFEIVQKELAVLAELFKNVRFKEENIKKQLQDEALYATDISDHLVQQGRVPFKEAHTIVGQLIRHKYKTGIELKAMSDTELKKFHKSLNSRIINKIIDPKASVESKKSIRRTRKKI